jgi:hypothetical protein
MLSRVRSRFQRAHITSPTGSLDPKSGPMTFVMAVGSSFDQDRPDAMMTCRMGYCHGFEQLGIPYLIVDVRDIADVADELPNPVCMFFGGDINQLNDESIRRLRGHRCLVWLYPWFRDSDRFFAQHEIDPKPWQLPSRVKQMILALQPAFGFTATVPSGLSFFEEWERRGIPVRSLPLACDTQIYTGESPDYVEFTGIQLAFVGGYWQSKGQQIDRYLRQFEDILAVYGYSKWPYSGYRGMLAREMEASLYRQARVSPTINEPTVALLKGQINERAFKVMGSLGCTVVDAVPAYRELYAEEELLVSENPGHFHEIVRALLRDDDLRNRYRLRGHEATMQRHTYRHRAEEILLQLGITMPADTQKK